MIRLEENKRWSSSTLTAGRNVKKTLVSDGKAVFLLEEGATVKLVDYESAFSDVADGVWYSSAVDFVAGRGLFSGVSEDQFALGRP